MYIHTIMYVHTHIMYVHTHHHVCTYTPSCMHIHTVDEYPQHTSHTRSSPSMCESKHSSHSVSYSGNCVFVCVCVCKCGYMCVCVRGFMCICVRMCVCTCLHYVCICTPPCPATHAPSSTHTQTRTQPPTQTPPHTHTHLHPTKHLPAVYSPTQPSTPLPAKAAALTQVVV